jgi:hypothetical protein
MQKMQSNDLLKSNENNEDNAKVTAYMNATIIIPSLFLTFERLTLFSKLTFITLFELKSQVY